MRITNKMITSKYIRSLNTLSTDLDKLNTQISSGRAFSKSSENTSAAIKAFQIRRDLSKTEGYQANIQHAQSSLTNTESALTHMQSLLQEAKDKILIGNTGTSSEDERKIVATELRSIQNQLLQALNSKAADVYYFGGTNTDNPPFTLDAVTGNLAYNGYPLDEPLKYEIPPGTPAENEDMINTLKKDSMYVDIGMGARITGTGVDPSSVFQYSIPGISIVGSGTTTLSDGITTVPNNIYDLLGAIADQMESSSFSYDTSDELYGKLSSVGSEIIYSLTEVGSKSSYLEFMTSRYETQDLDLEERQLAVEGADPVKTIINFKSQEVAYNAALQMGTKIIQPSIFDFMS